MAEHNLYVCRAEINRIKQAIREGRLWEHVEMRAHAHPALLTALKKVQKKSIAVIGTTAGKVLTFNAGNLFLKALIDFGYPGKLYAVGRSGGEVGGMKILSKRFRYPGWSRFCYSSDP